MSWKRGGRKRELVAASWTSSRQFSHTLWLKVHSHRLLRACLLGSKRKLPPPACQVQFRLPYSLPSKGVQFSGTVYICSQGPFFKRISPLHFLCTQYIQPLQKMLLLPTRATDTTWKLAWTLQEVQAHSTDHDLCLSYIYSQSFLLHCFFPSQEPPDTFLEWFSDNKVIGLEVLPEDPRMELVRQGFKHNDEEQRAEYRALVNTDLYFKFFTVPLTDIDMAAHIGIHPVH